MAKSRTAGVLRLLAAILAIAATGVGLAGMASAAPTFDVDGYSACTATTVPAPDEGFDAVVTRCCVQHAGVPADTRYGVGLCCGGGQPVDGGEADDRPSHATFAAGGLPRHSGCAEGPG